MEGVKVLDLTRNLAGPFCTMILADLGADVIKVESPGRGDDTRHWLPPDWNGESPQFLAANRNKRSVCVDLGTSGGVDVVLELVAHADVLVESFQPGWLDARGLGASALHDRHPGLIYCSITAYGRAGARAGLPGYDPVVQAYTGLMNLTGFPDSPPARLPIAALDLGAALWATIGIQAALADSHSRSRIRIETSLHDVAAWWLSYFITGFLASGQEPRRAGTATGFLAPYEAFETAEGEIMICAGNDRIFRALADALQAQHLVDDPRFQHNADRVEHRAALHDELERYLLRESAEEWESRLSVSGVPCSRLRTLGQLVEDDLAGPGSILRAMPHSTIPDLRLVDMPVIAADRRAVRWRPPPALGQDTDAVLAEVGLSTDRIEELRDQGVIS